MSKIKIPWAQPRFTGREKEHLLEALESTWISGGPYVDRFEAEFSSHIGSPYGLTVANGTVALQLAALVLGLGLGDEAIVPGFTFVAPANMVLAVGAKPVFVDIDARTWCIDPEAVERAITPATKAIFAVHLYGNMCDMDSLQRIAQTRGLALVEDAAEAAFSKYRGQQAGSFGDLGCFSFQATKTITMGEGGFVATPRADLNTKMRVIRDHGMRKDKRYWHDEVGFNFRLTNLQAALGYAQFEAVEEILASRSAMYQRYLERLQGVEGITLQHFSEHVEPAVWAVALRLDPAAFPPNRDAAMARLSEVGIETRPGFYPFSVMPLYQAPPLKVAEEVAAQVISLPSFPALTESEIDHICGELLKLRR